MKRTRLLVPISIALFVAMPLASCFAHDGAESLSFPAIEKSPDFQLPPCNREGDVLWESGPSQPAASTFEAVLIQGTLTDVRDSQLAFQASSKSGDSWTDWAAGEIVVAYPNGRFWAKIPLKGGVGDAVRLRAISRAPMAGGTLEIYGIELKPIGSGDDARIPANVEGSQDDQSLVKLTADLPPGVLPRSAWNAKPVKSPHRYEPMHALRLTVHHTEGAQPMTREAAIQEMQAIQSFHQNGRGWNDIAYHFLIDGTGQVWQGRPEGVVGSHVLARNDGSIGISLMGSFQKPKNQHPTEAQLNSLVALLRYLSAKHHIPVDHIFGHREQEPGHGTDCPGDILFAKLPEIRRLVAEPAPTAQRRAASLRMDGPAMRSLIEEARP